MCTRKCMLHSWSWHFLINVEVVFQYTGLYSTWPKSYRAQYHAGDHCPQSSMGALCWRNPEPSNILKRSLLMQLNSSISSFPALTTVQWEALRASLGSKGTLFKNVYWVKCHLGRKDVDQVPAFTVCENLALPFSCFFEKHVFEGEAVGPTKQFHFWLIWFWTRNGEETPTYIKAAIGVASVFTVVAAIYLTKASIYIFCLLLLSGGLIPELHR